MTVVAPAGYGKTTFLARWAEADPRAFAWVALDARDDDPVVLLRYVAGAMHRLEPLPPEVFDALSGPGGFGWAKRVVRLANALAARERPFVLAFDDLHAVNNPACLDVIAELLESVPAGSQIAVASREEPALPLGRWRAHGWVRELGPTELRLDDGEAELLLRAAGVELGEAEVTELTERTEGWPAGLYLAALSIQAGSPSSASAAAFTGDDRFVADYFRTELISRLPDDEARFLKHTSVLERMCGGLCDSVVESSGSADVLERLERTNSFVVPLDRRGEWYRYHHLFAELLRNELERSEPDVAAELNRRAMAWCVAHDLPEAAVVYGHAAGETDAVAGLVDALALPTHYDGRMETLEGWLRWFSEDDLRRYPALAVEGAWLRALTGRSEEAEAWLALRRGRDVGNPALGRQRDDRALGGDSAGGHDARRRRSGAPRRASSRSSSSLRGAHGGRPRMSSEASPMPCSAPPRARPKISRRRSSRRRAAPAEPVTLAHAELCASRGQAGSLERGGPGTPGRPRHWSRRRGSATIRAVRSSTWRLRASRSTRGDTRMPAQHSPALTASARCSTTAFPG